MDTVQSREQIVLKLCEEIKTFWEKFSQQIILIVILLDVVCVQKYNDAKDRHLFQMFKPKFCQEWSQTDL